MAKKKYLQDNDGQVWPITTADCVYLSDGSKTIKKYIDDGLAGKANSSHGTHLTLGTGASNAAAGNHTHSYAGSSSAGGAANSVKTNLIIKLNGGSTEGTNLFTFNGSTAKTVNITPSAIGAAASSHGTHLTLGTTSSTAYRGDYGNTAYNHSKAAHAPSNAQKNSDITKAEIEAKLTGAITSHTHTYNDVFYTNETHLDLTASKYNVNTWYPCVFSIPQYGTMHKIIVESHLTGRSKPSWGTHNFGFTATLCMLVKSCAWGTTDAETICLDRSCKYISDGKNPLGYTQMNNAGKAVVWCRGGGYYHLKKDWSEPVTIYTSSYTDCEETISPTTGSAPFYFSSGTIHSNINAWSIEAGERINVGLKHGDDRKIGFFNDNGTGMYMYGYNDNSCGVYDSINGGHPWKYSWDSGNPCMRTNCHFVPMANNVKHLGSTGNRWAYLYLTNSPNVSSDRSLKENIEYVHDEKTSISYNDMYNFVKDDLGLATYNFIGDDKQKMNFIAQDLLYNADGTDNKIGQMIVNPVAVPTEEEIELAKSKLDEGQEYEYPTLSYDMGMYISVLAGALKESINKIEELKNKILELESK
jgi:hypothetical protein